jgi:hypothetical protein
MTGPIYDETYNVVATDIFDQQWNDLVKSGVIDQIVRPRDFVDLRKQVLGSRPWIGVMVPGRPTNHRSIRFPSYISVERHLEIRYSIVEDDLKVFLEEIREVPAFGL